MKSIILIITILFSLVSASGQNLLGYNSERIKKYIEKNNTELNIVNGVKNDNYKYIKYEDHEGSRTVIFFMTDDDKCKSVKQIYVHSMKERVIAELDKSYKKIRDNEWADNSIGRRAAITLKVEDWFFTVSIKPQKNE